MRKLLTVLFFVFAANAVIAGNNDPNATQTLKGQVVDENGAALTGVEVTVEGLNKKVFTDFDGNFEIDGLNNGAYTLVVNFVAYKEAKNVVNTIQNNTATTLIQLQPKQLKIR